MMLSRERKEAGKVFELVHARRGRPPQLTDAELVAVRDMLDKWAQVSRACPVARGILERGR